MALGPGQITNMSPWWIMQRSCGGLLQLPNDPATQPPPISGDSSARTTFPQRPSDLLRWWRSLPSTTFPRQPTDPAACLRWWSLSRWRWSSYWRPVSRSIWPMSTFTTEPFTGNNLSSDHKPWSPGNGQLRLRLAPLFFSTEVVTQLCSQNPSPQHEERCYALICIGVFRPTGW